MRPFPNNFELESFFECEPKVQSEELPWAYNELEFNSSSVNGELYTKMITGSEIMYIKWSQKERNVMDLTLKGVLSLQLSEKDNYSTMVIQFRSHETSDLIIKIRPYISITWGYNDQQ